MFGLREELLLVLGHAVTLFIISPFKRVEMLMTVEEDLKRERILPQKGFGGVWGCIQFMYQSGGVRSFYRGALLEVGVSCFYKFFCNRYVVLPVARLLPVRMADSMVLATLLHTLVGVPLLSPVQMLLDTVVANLVTDFIPHDIAEKVRRAFNGSITDIGNNNNNNSIPNTPVAEGCENNSVSAVSESELKEYNGNDSIDQFINNNSIYKNVNNLKNESFAIPLNANGAKFRPRFCTIRDTVGAVFRTIPIRAMMGKLLFLDFLDRFFSSILYNKLLGFLISQFAIHSGMHSEAVSSLIWTLSPIIVSVGSSLLTFPLRNFLFTHFVRVRLYERIENDALKRLEEEKRYPNSEVRNESFSTAVTRMRKKCSQRQLYLMEDEAPPHDPDAVCGLIENMCHHLLHDEVRDYLRSTVDLDGFAALYNGFSVYVSSIFASVLVGASLRVTVRFIKAHASH